MLAEAFVSILIMTLVGTGLTAILLVLKPLTKRVFGYKWQFYIWLSVLIVMVLPVKVSNEMVLPDEITSGIKAVVAEPEIAEKVLELPDGVYMIRPTDEGTGKTVKPWFDVLSVLWLGGFVFFFCRVVFRYLKTRKVFYSRSSFLGYMERAEIRVSEELCAPVMFGGRRSVLFVPKALCEELFLIHIIKHERVHLRRNDIVYKWFAVLVKSVHWFNPIVYFVARQIDEMCEISCDVEATREMEESEKRSYMQTLLDISQQRLDVGALGTVGLSSGGMQMKKRFEAIIHSKGNNRLVYLAGTVLAMLLTFGSVLGCAMLRGSAENIPITTESVLLSKKEEAEESNSEIPPTVREVELEKENEPILLPFAESEKPESKPIADEKYPEIPEEPEKPMEEKRVTLDRIEAGLSVVNADYVKRDFSSDGGESRTVSAIKPDKNGKFSIAVSSNTDEVIDVYIRETNSKRSMLGYSVPVNKEGNFVFEGFDPEKQYDITLKGTMRNNWEIESEFIIY